MKKQNRQAYQFLTPFIILVSIFYVVPAILTIAMLHHPLTDQGIEKFKADYCKVFGE